MNNSKKYFSGGINNDDLLNLLDDGDYLNLVNGRIGISEYGKDKRIENILGTTEVYNSKYPPYGVNLTIGSCIDIEEKRLIWCVYNTFNDHGIYAYSFETQTVYAVLYDSQIEGGLGFDKNFRIDRNCRVIGGLFFWTNNKNEPKKINIDSGIKLNQTDYVTTARSYTSLTDSYEINLIRRPPVYPPIISKKTDTGFVNNFIALVSLQFAWQYIYFDGEESVLSGWSIASKLNGVSLDVEEPFNYIKCLLNGQETIPQTVRIIRLVVKNQDIGVTNVIKTYDKLVNESVFINHNSGLSTISFNFYNDIIGETIDSVAASIPYHSVPLLSKTLESAINRIFLGNNLMGYDTPTTLTSLTVTGITSTAGGNTDPMIIGTVDNQNSSPPFTGYYHFTLSGTPQVGDTITLNINVYDSTQTPTNANTIITYTVATTSLATVRSDLNFLLQANSVLGAYHFNAATQDTPLYSTYLYSTNTESKVTYATVGQTYINPPSSILPLFFKNESYFQFGTVFYDKALRKCGVSTRPELLLTTPQKTYANNVGFSNIQWGLSNNNSVNEIPNWAYYYSIVRTLNQKTRYFIDSIATLCYYANKNLTTDVYEYTATTYSIQNTVAIAISTIALVNNKMGYVFNEGDVCVIIISSGTRYELPVLGQDGIYILIKPRDIGSLLGATLHYEIYTPYIKTENEPYYEVGNMFPVTNPTLSNRTYSVLSGSLSGDTFFLPRSYNSVTFNVEAMSPNDRYYQFWYTDAGRINLITLLGQVRDEHQIRYSGTYIKGTQNNNLSNFQALNFKTLPLGMGSLQKLQLASKTEEQGVIMLAICSFQTASCYLGEVQVIGASQNAFLAQDASVIGTINVLKGMFGTTAPETVIEYLGLVFWYDLNNGCIVQYSSNGLEQISRFKMQSFFQRYAKNYLTASSGNLDNINGFHHIPTSINPFTKRLQVTTPGFIYPNYATTLPGYSSVPPYAKNLNNYFNIYTELAQTVCYDIIENRWKESFEFAGEWYDYFENIMIGWKNGTIYTHETNVTNLNTFYGTQYPLRICLTTNMPPSGIKDIFDIAIEGNAIPDFSVLYSDYPWVQLTDLNGATDYRTEEGVQFARFFRDRLSKNTGSNDPDFNLNFGDVIKSQIPQIMLEFHSYASLIYINCVNIGWSLSRGVKNIVNK